MSAIGSAIAITWAKFGLKIEKTIENQDMLEIYISVPERSFHQNASGEEMSGMTLAKKVQNNSGRDGSKKTYRQISYTDRRSLDKRTVR